MAGYGHQGSESHDCGWRASTYDMGEVKNMPNTPRILIINGAYRDGGVTDRLLAEMLDELRQQGVSTSEIRLRDTPIEFCLNCRECMQQPGTAPGTCVIDDGMAGIIARIDAADGYIFAAPTNFSYATAIFKRFMERLAPFGYWPWGAMAPTFRKDGQKPKPVVLVSSSAAPGFLGRLSFGSLRELKIAARTIGAKPVGRLFAGLMSGTPEPVIPDRTVRRARSLARQLA